MANSTPRTDEEFFKLYCASADITYNNGEEEAIFIKDKNLQFHYLSPLYRRTLSPNGSVILNEDELDEEGKKAREIHKKRAYEQDDEIRRTLKPRDFLYIDVYNRIGLIHKRPIINPDTGNFVGIIGSIKPFSMPNVLKLIYKINGITFGLANQEQRESIKYELTERQSMVLFLYLNRYSNTEISDITTMLGYKISRSRVNDHLENLKYIFQVKSKELLIEKAIAMGYHRMIPRQFLKQGSYEFDEEIIICG